MPNVNLPAGWSEVPPDEVLVQEAFDLVTGTFPKRYLHYEVPDLIEKMNHVRRNNNDEGNPGPEVRSLRVFTHSPPGAIIDVAVFFFLRFRSEPRAYSLSLGISPSVTASVLYQQLLAISGYLQKEQNELGGVSTIDVLSHKVDLEADLDDVPELTVRVGQAFKTACLNRKLTYIGEVNLGPPWPWRLYRWTLAQLP